MSFGFAVGDFIALGNLAWNVYKECKSASAEFQEARNEVISLHTAIRELQDEAENKDSILNRAGLGRKQELDNLMRNCSDVLNELEQLLTRYRSLGTKHKRTWDRVKFGSEGLQEIRSKLMFHTSALTLFLTSLGTGSLGRIEKKLDDLAAEIRAGQHEPSLISICDEEDKFEQDSAWRGLMSELSEEFSRDEIEAYKGDIVRYIRGLLARGDLDELAPSPASFVEEHLETTPSHTSEPKEGPFTGTIPHRTRWPPQPRVESGSESTGPTSRKRLINDPTSSGSDDDVPSTGETSNSKGISTPDDCSESVTPPTKRFPVNTIEDLFPPRSPTKSSRRRLAFVGVDVNFDSCRVGAYDTVTSTPIVLSNEHGSRSTPTYIAFTPDNILIGEDAKNQASRNVENTFFGFTTLLGKLFDDEITLILKDHSSFQIDDQEGKPAFFAPCRGKHYSPEELTAFLIKKIVHVAEMALGQADPQVYICAHGPLDSFRREAYHRAAALAKVNLAQLRNRTTAAAFKYVTDQRQEHMTGPETLLVVDVRIDGCDCSIFQFEDDVVEAMGTYGHFNRHLSLDVCLGRLLCSSFYANHPEITSPLSPRGMARLTKAVEEARRQLLSATKAEILIDSFIEGLALNVQTHQTQVEDMVERYTIPELVECYKRLLERSSTRVKLKETKVILIGELARLHQVRNTIEGLNWNVFAATAFISQIDPMECAVLGTTADHANVLGGNSDKLILDCTSSSLSIATYSTQAASKTMNIIFKLGDMEPIVKRKELFTMKNYQEGALLRFFANKEFDIEEYRLYFEVAFSLPVKTRQRGPYALTLIVSYSGHSSELDITVHRRRYPDSQDDGGSSEVLFKMCRSSTGLVTVKHGECMPITPYIRENWRVTADEPSYKEIEGERCGTDSTAVRGPMRVDREKGPNQKAAREKPQDKRNKTSKNRYSKERNPLRN